MIGGGVVWAGVFGGSGIGTVGFGEGCVMEVVNMLDGWPVEGGGWLSCIMFLGLIGEFGESIILFSRIKTRFCRSVLSISGSNNSGDDLLEPLVRMHLKYLHTKHNQCKPENNKQNY